MRRARKVCGVSLAAVAVASALSLVSVRGAGAAPSDGIHNIQHVIVIMQENRSFE